MESEMPTVLVVDDVEDNLDLLEFALKRKPIRFLRATSGKQCLVLAQEKKPDIIVLDIQMPEMDGFETLRHLRANPGTMKIPVIFLTAQRKDPASIEKGLELGAEEFLTKPIDIEELLVRTRMLVRLKRAETELERTKADFMAMLVHDLRSPLAGIKNVIDYFQELRTEKRSITEDHFMLLDSAKESAVRMLDLINDILELSKFDAGNLILEKNQSSIKDIITKVTNEMRWEFERRHVTLHNDFGDVLPPVDIDSRKVEQVIMNLIGNSLKFVGPSGVISIKVRPMTEKPIGVPDYRNYVRISVTDNGVGISPEDLPHIFDRYKQGASAKKVREHGTGLGLAVCRMIVEAHEGTISAESELGKYTTFHFTLPVK